MNILVPDSFSFRARQRWSELMGVAGEGVINEIKRLEDRAWKLMKCHVRNKRVVYVNVVVGVPENNRMKQEHGKA